MKIVNNDEILQHCGITESDLMNYYGLSKAQYDDYIAHYGIKGMLWGFANGIRQAGKRIAQGLDYDYQNNQYNKKVGEATTAAFNAKKTADNAYKARQNYLNTGLNRSFASGSDSSFKNMVKANNAYTQAKKNVQSAVNARNNFQNSAYGKTLAGIKKVRTTVNTAISTVKSSNAYKKGTALAGKVVNKIGSMASSALSNARSKGIQIYSKLFGTKYDSSIGPTRTKTQALGQSINSGINKAASTISNTKNKVVGAIKSSVSNLKNKASAIKQRYNHK